jgi:hypothetical protein
MASNKINYNSSQTIQGAKVASTTCLGFNGSFTLVKFVGKNISDIVT